MCPNHAHREVMRHTRQNVTLECGVSYDPRVHNETSVSWNKDGDELGEAEEKRRRRPDSTHYILGPFQTRAGRASTACSPTVPCASRT